VYQTLLYFIFKSTINVLDKHSSNFSHNLKANRKILMYVQWGKLHIITELKMERKKTLLNKIHKYSALQRNVRLKSTSEKSKLIIQH